MVSKSYDDSPFAAVLRGDAPGTIIARDDERRFAIIASLEPEPNNSKTAIGSASSNWWITPSMRRRRARGNIRN